MRVTEREHLAPEKERGRLARDRRKWRAGCPPSDAELITHTKYERLGNMMSSWMQYEYDDVMASVVSYANTNHYERDAFGRAVPGSTPWEPMSSPAPKEHLTGKMYDNVTGLYYFHARWYDPEVGRFVSKDTGLFSKNLYSFDSGNPMLFYDPDGRETVLGLYIPSYVTLSGSFLQNENRKPCPCNRSDLPLINDYIRFYQDMVEWYKDPEKHPQPKSPLEGKPVRAAHTGCTECHGMGMTQFYATYRERTGEARMETAAYNSQISCLQGEKNRILGR